MATGSLLNALGLQRWNVATAISAELCQLALLYRWCARPTLGIYGYLLAMFLTGVSAAAVNLAILTTDYKGEATGSDKHFSFALPACVENPAVLPLFLW